MQRREVLLAGAALICLAPGLPVQAAGAVTPRGPAERLAEALLANLPPADLAKLRDLMRANGWTERNRPALAALAPAIGADFRADRTVMLQRLRLSVTEAGWLLAGRVG